jgi:hypothetical protein
MRESWFEREVLVKGVEARGGACWKFVTPGRVGAPDRIILLNGKARFAECKRPGERARPEQLVVHETLRDLGFDVVVLSAADDYAEFLRSL